jgi:hypothetical protein
VWREKAGLDGRAARADGNAAQLLDPISYDIVVRDVIEDDAVVSPRGSFVAQVQYPDGDGPACVLRVDAIGACH